MQNLQRSCVLALEVHEERGTPSSSLNHLSFLAHFQLISRFYPNPLFYPLNPERSTAPPSVLCILTSSAFVERRANELTNVLKLLHISSINNG